MAVTRDVNRADRAKTAFQLCKHRCLLDEVIALELELGYRRRVFVGRKVQVGGLQSNLLQLTACPSSRLDVLLTWITKFKQPECHPGSTDSQ